MDCKEKILYVLYRCTAARLPISQRSKFAKAFRCFWAKRIVARCGRHVNIERNAVFSPGLSIGDRSGAGIACELYGPVTIGKDVMMGPEVVIYTSGHRHDRTDIPMGQQGDDGVRPVVIGDDVWIGRRAIIMPGVKIGNGCIIGAAAVVTHDIPDYSIAAGVPARVVKNRLGEMGETMRDDIHRDHGGKV